MNQQERQRQFEEWAEQFDNLLWKVARTFAAGPDQDDLHQELLLALWQAIPAYRCEAKSATFAYRVAYNRALTWLRKQTPQETPLDSAATPAAPQAEPEWRLERLYEQIRTLSPVDRALIILYLDELSYREMSEVLGISESNVGVRINRVKKLLAERMKEEANA